MRLRSYTIEGVRVQILKRIQHAMTDHYPVSEFDAFELTEELEDEARSFKIADAHCHIYPAKIAVKAARAVGAFYDQPMNSISGDAETLIEHGGRIGCSRYLVCSVATSLSQVDSINRFIARECTEHPQFVGLGAWHEDVSDLDALLDQIEYLGLKGVKVHPDFQKVAIDDPRLVSLYSALSERGLCILMHMGDARYDYSAPSKLARILERFDKLKIDAAHLGGWQRWDEAYSCLKGSQAYYDISSSAAVIGVERAAEIAHGYGADKLMFGSDFPMWNHAAEFARTMQLGFERSELEGVFYGNFSKFYGLGN